MRIRVGRRLRRSIWGVATGALLVLLIVGALGVFLWHTVRARSQNVLPGSIATQLDFSPLILADAKGLKADSYKYDTANRVLSYIVTNVGTGARLTVTEQTQPAQFTEITGYQDQFLTNVIQQSETIQTSNGTVYIGHPSKQPTQQIGVIIDRGLLIFFTPLGSSQLNTSEWRTLVEQLEIQRIL